MKFVYIAFVALLFFQAACSNRSIISKNTKINDSEIGLDVSCIGPVLADRFVIYLHGMDSVVPSKQELQNRTILNNLANILNIRFAIPRAKEKCPTQPEAICWGWKFDQTELSTILPKIIESRSKCFSTEKPFAMLGFSNGGYLLMRWFSKSFPLSGVSLPTLIIASGSGKGYVSSSINNLSSIPKLILVIGKQDKFNFDPSELLFKNFQKLNAPVQLIEFDGGHELNQDALEVALKSIKL